MSARPGGRPGTIGPGRTGRPGKEELVADTTIQTRKNGPLLVTGAIHLVDAEGKPVPPKPGSPAAVAGVATPVALCRCGQSKVKPYCDGSHKAAGFEG
jgi:CDGSH-type Zn-finger protein